MTNKLSYLGGHSKVGSSAHFAGWGNKKKKTTLLNIGLLALADPVPEDQWPSLIPREKMKAPKQSKLVRQLRKEAAKKVKKDTE